LCYSEVPRVFGVYISAPGAPLLLPLFPLCRAAAPPLAAVSHRPRPPCLSWPPRVTRELAHRLNPFLLAFPERATPLRRCSSRQELLAVAGHRRSPPLQLCRRHLLPLVAPTCCPQADRRHSPSPLAFSRARHAAPPLPELCPAATSPLSWLVPCVPPPPFFSSPRPSVASPPSILLSLAVAFHPEPRIHHRRPCSSPVNPPVHRGQTTPTPPDPQQPLP
jgi:hypothetical protein